LKNFTGIDSPYESPDAPEIHLKSAVNAAEECVQQVLAKLI
jgi:adenylylsulfate kinase-like enzyme